MLGMTTNCTTVHVCTVEVTLPICNSSVIQVYNMTICRTDKLDTKIIYLSIQEGLSTDLFPVVYDIK